MSVQVPVYVLAGVSAYKWFKVNAATMAEAKDIVAQLEEFVFIADVSYEEPKESYISLEG